MDASIATPEAVAAYIGIDWADQKHAIALRSAAEPSKIEHQLIDQKPEALMEWIGQLEQRFGTQSKILVCLEQSRGALIFHLMGYEFFELYPVNPLQLARYRETFSPGGAKDDRPDSDLLCELVYCHGDRLRALKPDSVLGRKLSFFNEGRREAVDQATRLSNAIQSQLKVYFPLALELLDQDSSTALAADLLLRWPTLEAIQKQSAPTLRKFFYGHNCRGEKRMLHRLELVQKAKPLTKDSAVIEPAALRVQMLARQLKNLLPDIARYDDKIAQLFEAHPERFLFENLPGAGKVLAPRLASAFGSNAQRWQSALEIATLSGIAPVRRASGLKSGKKGQRKASVHFRQACPKFLRQSFHEFAGCSIRYCPWAKAHYEAQRARGNGHHAAVRSVAFKWIRILFACWKHRTSYDPQRYLQALQDRGSPLASTCH
jgi:Transposase/Transposase IS116/IS110/IS902 family